MTSPRVCLLSSPARPPSLPTPRHPRPPQTTSFSQPWQGRHYALGWVPARAQARTWCFFWEQPVGCLGVHAGVFKGIPALLWFWGLAIWRSSREGGLGRTVQDEIEC